MTQSGNPKRNETLIINDEGEAPSLLNPTTGQILIVNAVGKRIVELADGSRGVDAIAESISREFSGSHRHDVTSHVTQFLAESTEKGIIEWTES